MNLRLMWGLSQFSRNENGTVPLRRKQTNWGLSQFWRSENGTVPLCCKRTVPLRTSHSRRRPSGFSLLEVILALAILTGAIATLGEVARLALRNAQIARDSTQAQLLCESKLAEITAGITLPDPITNVPLETTLAEDTTSGILDESEIGWLYSISLDYTDELGMVAVTVTVAQDLPEEKRPARFALVRWIPDPGLELSEETTEETSEM